VYHVAVHDEVVILDARRSVYISLNRTATVVWAALAGGQTQEQAAAGMTELFRVSPDQAWSDVSRLVEDLVGRGLLERLEE